ncbi:MAG: anaerobic ribonucleoside-triphosphate reductase activating protein [Firmicutes bacterium]|nr:anaerobic ribonucleoside-triphosphate reductase activating protein [Bacillota bacterium]
MGRGVIRIAGFNPESVVDGPGLRFVVYTQGCPHRCPGCQNPETWDPEGGHEVTLEDLWSRMEKNPLLRGLTLSGGEPFLQAGACAELAARVRAAGLDVVTYTGYTWEQLVVMAEEDPDVRALLTLSDYLIDGPYLAAQRTLGLAFRGSRNQRFIDVARSLAAGRAVEADLVADREARGHGPARA